VRVGLGDLLSLEFYTCLKRVLLFLNGINEAIWAYYIFLESSLKMLNNGIGYVYIDDHEIDENPFY